MDSKKAKRVPNAPSPDHVDLRGRSEKKAFARRAAGRPLTVRPAAAESGDSPAVVPAIRAPVGEDRHKQRCLDRYARLLKDYDLQEDSKRYAFKQFDRGGLRFSVEKRERRPTIIYASWIAHPYQRDHADFFELPVGSDSPPQTGGIYPWLPFDTGNRALDAFTTGRAGHTDAPAVVRSAIDDVCRDTELLAQLAEAFHRGQFEGAKMVVDGKGAVSTSS